MSGYHYIFACFVLLFYVYLRSKTHKIQCVLPAPKVRTRLPLGIDGVITILQADAESRLMDLFISQSRQIGHTLEYDFLGTRAFFTIDPTNIATIMSANFKEWGIGLRTAILFPFFGDGIFTQEGDRWKHSREILRPYFHCLRYADLDIFKGAVDDLLDNLSEGGVFDLQPLFSRLSLDVITALLLGESVRSLKSSESARARSFIEAYEIAWIYITKRFRHAHFHWLIGGSKFRKACKVVQRFVDQAIEQNLSLPLQEDNGEPEDNPLRALASNIQDRSALIGQIINTLAAGRDSTACLLSWAFFLLVRHPKIMEKLREEVASFRATESPLTREHLKRMKYLDNVLKETLRLYPSLPVSSRTALKTTILPTGGGDDGKKPILVPQGLAVGYSIYALHRRHDLYGEDAEDFRPERWDQEMPLKRDERSKNWGYIPFSGGPRICLGADFALTSAKYTIIRILQQFPIIKLPDGVVSKPVGLEKQKVSIVISPAEGCLVKLQRRL